MVHPKAKPFVDGGRCGCVRRASPTQKWLACVTPGVIVATTSEITPECGHGVFIFFTNTL